MQALIWTPDGEMVLRNDVETPNVSRSQVRVRVRAVGVCTTDVHMVQGILDFAKPPWILGHEMAGVIDIVGEDVVGWNVGDPVIVDPVVTCGQCHYCQTGRKYLCADGGELGTTLASGGYGEYVIVGPSNLYPLPPKLSFDEGAMMEPLNCTLGAIARVPNMVGSHVLVFGPGPAGLLFTQLAKAYGAISVTLVGLDDERLALGRRLGADKVVNISEESLKDAVDSNHYDVTVEASGSERAVGDCFHYVAPSGTVLLYGLTGLNRATINSDTIVGKDLTVVTCTSAPLLWTKCVQLVSAGKINVKDIITERVAMADAADAVNDVIHRRRQPVKMVLLHPDQTVG